MRGHRAAFDLHARKSWLVMMKQLHVFLSDERILSPAALLVAARTLLRTRCQPAAAGTPYARLDRGNAEGQCLRSERRPGHEGVVGVGADVNSGAPSIS